MKVILQQNIKGEQCAISSYQKLMQKTQTTDSLTYNIVLQIIEQEVDGRKTAVPAQDTLRVEME